MKKTILLICIISMIMSFSAYSFEATEDIKYVLNITFNEDEKSEVNAVIDNFYNEFIAGKIENTDKDWKYKRELLILRYLVEGSQFEWNPQYDYRDYKSFGVSTAYGALINKKAVCQGWAHAFSLLCDKCEIENYILDGPDHNWNAVRLDDGNLYHVDVAYIISEGKKDYYTHCNLNDVECKKLGYAHSAWYPEIVATGGVYGHLMYQLN